MVGSAALLVQFCNCLSNLLQGLGYSSERDKNREQCLRNQTFSLEHGCKAVCSAEERIRVSGRSDDDDYGVDFRLPSPPLSLACLT